ncbi:hypothetical protein [Nitrosococcus wardiae]|uniref:Recombinase domain-containing protein n=1 Tax=Nitrosococcus wardiae TaxID=1814290 RepID=A0A4P7C3P3_9GAMM|nr:hypothetical protein [Nitrosococcus wardiae]QBQ56214.1 hypothetical protein E3U44_18190 [Nitrosococcus wardiae]
MFDRDKILEYVKVLSAQNSKPSTVDMVETLNKLGFTDQNGFEFTEDTLNSLINPKPIKPFDTNVTIDTINALLRKGYNRYDIVGLLNNDGYRTDEGLEWNKQSLDDFMTKHKLGASEKPL